MVKTKTLTDMFRYRADMDYHRSHCSLDLRDLLRGVPTFWHPFYPWRESKGLTNVHYARP